MIKIVIVGGGVYGSLAARKYIKFPDVEIRALISPTKSDSEYLKLVPYFKSPHDYKNFFGSSNGEEIFDICVHQINLLSVLENLIAIGGRSFILPKPIALKSDELLKIQNLKKKYNLKIAVASQWHYSALIKSTKNFIDKNRENIKSVELNFSRNFDDSRLKVYSPITAFLPHIIQILFDLDLINCQTTFRFNENSDIRLELFFSGAVAIKAVSELKAGLKKDSIRIHLHESTEPDFFADLAGIIGDDGFLEYPFISTKNKKMEFKEDILEQMIRLNLEYFRLNEGTSSEILTLERYTDVAKMVVSINELGLHNANKTVTVIGGGIFGVLSALNIARCGYKVNIFEKNDDIISEASLVNQCRVHMGYHYPRDERTVCESLEAKKPFEDYFGKSVIREIDNYYLVAREGSKTSKNEFIEFCKRMNLPYKESWPEGFGLNREMLSLSVNVPENIFDANRERDFLIKKINQAKNISLYLNTEVNGITRKGDIYKISYKCGEKGGVVESEVLINATYAGINFINDMLGLPLDEFQYELCEVPVVKTNWSGAGWSIIDGAFFGVMPFGYSDEYLFYDVELSVLERSIGKFPKFNFDRRYYDEPRRRKERFEKYKVKWGKWMSGLDDCTHVSSMYTTRIVLPRRDSTDTRPSIVNELLPGYWQVFSGKVACSAMKAVELGNLVNLYFDKRRPKL